MPRAGMAQNWRPTFHLSTAGCNQRNSRTDRLAWERLMNCPPINGSAAAAFEKPVEGDRKNDIQRVGRTISPDRPQETVEALGALLSRRFFPCFPQSHFGVILLTKSECWVLEFPSTA